MTSVRRCAMAIRRFLCVVIALCLLLGSAVAEGGEIAATAVAEAFAAYDHNGRVTLIDGATVETPVTDFKTAKAVIDGVLDQLGGDANTALTPWRDLTDAFGNRYYVFQQMYDNTTVLGGAVKVMTDAEGRMLGLTASIEANPSEVAAAESITAEQAEAIVLAHAMDVNQQALNLVEGRTERMILPLTLEIDIEAEGEDGSRYVWVVYTDNPESSLAKSSDLPYLAHYVTLTGEYLYSLPTMMPGDEAGASGFDASYVFEFMEPVEYVGYVDLSTGEEKEIAVTVMRDKRTGMYYLGNLERRIVIGDCWSFLYDGNRVVLEYSPDNLEWDQVGLLTLYNYCRAYDYYREIGWIGGDGLGTPILVLNNYCDKNRAPVDNACYMGNYLGWQLFAASGGNDYSQCLDVLGHEFTHCVTGSAMTYNAYMNDHGAINEAMSDIQGKTCEMMLEGRENVSWTMGDKSVVQIRSMDEPHRFQQPEHTWDVYYTPNVATPTDLNDRGGVHTNSSLLNRVACLLYEEGGMTLEEGRAFWFTVDCAMAPGTDYAQLSELLPWALKAAGLQQYDAALRSALDATRMGVEDIPTTFDADRALLTLRLPEQGIYSDGQWIMMLCTVNVDKLIESAKGIIGRALMGDYSDLPDFARQLLAEEQEAQTEAPEAEKGLMKTFMETFMEELEREFRKDDATDAAETPEAPAESAFDENDRIRQELLDWVQEHLSGVLYSASTNAGQDGQTMRLVSIPGYALPVLMHGVFNQNTSEVEDNDMLVYVGGQWIDINALMQLADEAGDRQFALPEEMDALFNRFLEHIGDIHSLNDALDMIFYRIEGGKTNEVPAANLKDMEPVLTTLETAEAAAELPVARKSRPKLEAVEEKEAA